MAQSGYTPIILYFNNTTSTAPSLVNLQIGELAVNSISGKLYYRTSAGVVSVIADASTVAPVTTLSFGSTGLTPNTATSGAITVAGTLGAANGGTGITSLGTGVATALGQNVTGTGGLVLATSATLTSASLVTPALGTPVSGNFSSGTFTWPTFNQNTTGTASNVTGVVLAANGGTGLSTYTAGDLLYYVSGTALTKLAIGTNGFLLTSNGSAPQWTSPSSFGVSTINFSTTGLTPNTATGGAITVAGTLVSGNGGTGFSTYATGDVIYASAPNTLSKLTAGTNGYVLTLAAGVPSWAAASGGVTTINFGSTGLTPNTATGGAINVAGTLGAGYGGSGLSTFAVGDIMYASAITPTISKLAIGTVGQVMVVNSGGTAPQWSAQSTLAVGTATNVAGGAAGSILYQTGASVTTTLAIGTAYNILAVNAGGTAPSYQTQTSLLDNNFSSVQGTILYRSATAWTALGTGTAGYYLQTGGAGANPLWAAVAAGLTGFTAALNTSAPNATNNVSSITASGGTTNQFVALVPKGTGGLMAQIPDSAATGGNVRGTNATDWQQARNNNTEVASGSKAVICGGEANTSAGNRSFVGAGYNNNISTAGFASGIMGGYNNEISGMLNGYATVAGGNDNRCLGVYADWATIGGGQGNRATGTGSTIAGGFYGTTNSISKAFVYGGGAMGASTANSGGNQFGIYPLGTTTTTSGATILVSDTGAASNTNQVLLRTNSAVSFRAVVVCGVTGGGNMKAFTIVGAIKQGSSAATTALVGTPAINIDAADAGASTWTATATADTSNGGLAITVTGQASTTIKWMATVYTTEIGF